MKILAVQNRMGIGDTVIFLPYIKAISQKFRVPVSLLVKENSKADQFLNQSNYIDKIIILERIKNKNSRHDGILGSFKLANDLRKHKFDKIFIFNSSLRFNLIAKLAGIKDVHQYPLFKKTNQHITQPAKDLIKQSLKSEITSNPEIQIDQDLIESAISKFDIKNNQLNILHVIAWLYLFSENLCFTSSTTYGPLVTLSKSPPARGKLIIICSPTNTVSS